ncbi:cupin domain-containing protein [Rhizobium phaseoli]|uniref:cupin domain-containing protein n=1 Tax=Rhizobium phaseoli TaxID=396 RepID=UPI000BE8CAF8|nr:cupin domain-containing protein [Rhizobium phaseoli]PDS28330.1 hypothetical protein CO650_26710 [Rhizobium phaseoli]
MEHSPQIVALNWTGHGDDIAHRITRGAHERNPTLERRLISFEDREAGLQVGVSAISTAATQMRGEWKDELLTVQKGRATVQLIEGGEISLEAGDTAFISAGTVHRWIYHEPFVKNFLWLLGEESGPPTALKVDPAMERDSSPSPSRDVLLTETPSCTSKILHHRPDGRLTLMLWSTTPYARLAVKHAKHELMHFISGSPTLIDAQGCEVYNGTPNSVFVPKGAEIAWQNDEDVLKIACFVS